jgi:outer membrane protein TolC
VALAGVTLVPGCALFLEDADREVYSVTERAQMAAVGQTTDVHLGRPILPTSAASTAYDFEPSPVKPEVPDTFRRERVPLPSETAATEVGAQAAPADPEETAEPVEDPPENVTEEGEPRESTDLVEVLLSGGEFAMTDLQFGEVMTLSQALAYSTRSAREYQDAKEDLYLRALDLTLERHLWTPRFMSGLSTEFTEFPANSTIDRALNTVADFAMEQRLPYGGQIVARWVGTMVRDLENHVATGESGTAILEASLPLLRGAGRVAYESRYQAERNLIYECRRYERFRRQFLTRVASDYFQLLSARSTIANAVASRDRSRRAFERVEALAGADKVVAADKDRAEVDFLQDSNRVVDAIENYESLLDEFKLLIGMPTVQPFDTVDEKINLREPVVEEDIAIEVALASRLDLVTSQDLVQDSRRSLEIAKNNMLPDLNITGSLSYTTRADHLDTLDFREDDETWRVGLDLEIPLDRKAERNQLRGAVIGVRRAQRNYERDADRVRLEVRRSIRQIRRDRFTLDIQWRNIKSNEVREERASLLYEQGEGSFLDQQDAQNDLRQAQDDYANALADLRRSILQALLATGTLRVDPEGRWLD